MATKWLLSGCLVVSSLGGYVIGGERVVEFAWSTVSCFLAVVEWELLDGGGWWLVGDCLVQVVAWLVALWLLVRHFGVVR